ncbi:MAG TPA: lysylphosphatidylglycerol synthase domain-containing protein [Rhodanobacteraceae bacterium]|nr:lysylphosphatidylglycerol synthase domain-containing protein [Rhodanobacteraceae bacterium]
MKNPWRGVLRIAILLVTIAIFAGYTYEHPELLDRLGRMSPDVVVTLLLLYIVWFAALALTVQMTLGLCHAQVRASELGLLTAYSTLMNFFVPGQSGLIVRGVYMKKQHGLAVKRYLLASLIYYACYAVISAFMLLVASRPWWQTVGGLALAGLGSFVVVRWYERRSEAGTMGLDLGLRSLGLLLFATAVQACVQVAVYGFELHVVEPGIRFSQALTFTGAANFSLFVALTPGAIGIRESFLYFSRELHHVGTATIVAASVLDRTVFMLLLALLFVVSIVFHAKRALKIN